MRRERLSVVCCARFGYASLEATACGTPVVVVGKGEFAQIIIDGINGLLRDCDIDELANAVEWMPISRLETEALGRRGVDMAPERFSLCVATDQLIGHFEETIRRKNEGQSRGWP